LLIPPNVTACSPDLRVFFFELSGVIRIKNPPI
jgi:hypothetical protein